MSAFRSLVHLGLTAAQMLFTLVLVVAGLILCGYTALCALGHADWLVLRLQFGSQEIEAGWMVQTGLAALMVGLCAYLPANARILALETSHRRFSITMGDVARAYAAVHRADREGAFTLSHEFDAVKERLAYLRDHPDLGELEPDVLEVAAQMGVISRELAQIYSTEKVERAKRFLTQRQEEVVAFQDRLEEIKVVANDMRNWAMRVEIEEDVARAEIARLREMLDEILPDEDTTPVRDATEPGRTLITMPNRQAAE